MIRFSTAPIRIQLIVLAVLLTLPALGIIIYSGLKQRSDDYRQAVVESQKLADNLTAAITDLAREAEQLGGILADLPDVKNRNTGKVQAILARTIRRYPQYNAILIADEAGTVWATTHSIAVTTSIADRRYFKQAQTARRFSSGEFVVSKVKQNPTIHLAYPLLDKATFRGVVIMAFNLEVLRAILDRSRLSEDTNYVLTDHHGIIIDRGRSIGQDVGKPIQQADLKRMENGPDKETYEFTRVDGDRRIVSYSKLQLDGEQTPFMYVRAGLSIREAVAKANLNLLYNIAVLLPFVLAAFLLALFIGKRSIVDRIIKLQTASEQLAHGDLNTRVAHLLEGGDLGRLGESFDDMAQKLADNIRERQATAEEYRAVIQMTSDGVHVCDTRGRILEANAAYCSLVGFPREELLTMTIADLEAQEDSDMVQVHLSDIITMGSDSFCSKHRHKNGSIVDVEITVTYLQEHGGRFFSFVRDITRRKKIEEELLRVATYDRLTGVLNRQALEDKILTEMERAKRYEHSFSLIMLDIDNFKLINDTFGHLAGDIALSSIAGIVRQSVRVVDHVGRWGGEEFMILLAEAGADEATHVAEKLRTTLAGHAMDEITSVTASFGVTAYQVNDTLDSLIKRVDDRLYAAKKNGKNRVAAWS
jgi:diguanylate cyclase (GGDEF)-like protein/PAS domain S-box-containing protein